MRLFPLIMLLIAQAEITLFYFVGQQVGLLPTLALVFLTAVIGSILVRQQGLRAWAEFQRSAATGEGEVGLAIFTGICLLLAGAFLITPGFLTDAIGLLLLVPPGRQGIYAALKSRMGAFATNVTLQGYAARQRGGATIIDIEGNEVNQKGS